MAEAEKRTTGRIRPRAMGEARRDRTRGEAVESHPVTMELVQMRMLMYAADL